MTREDYEYAKSIYDKMFWMQVFKPEEMKEAHRRLFGSEASNVQQARGRVAAFFRYNVTPVFSDETISVSNEGQSHQEDEVKEMLQLDEDFENSQPIDNQQSENSHDGDNQIVKPKRKRVKK